ncbi:hypothetical protein EDEG_00650 [Edhazardia aedis USNM 41457]|uniref:Uncharacterized protein n=1 Tax=Edhazardia aedis (strain USNM 41457) TaxID=1003232 RepID=J9DVH7_EDHAE|nr:hypothetical protein EDEG_00650 [Edhazardia aedis USNM 41457]|eukprot:EJW05292.1 hypothetical protein EDEG_00650 [Edhazardia aedis USNM 41457]
MWMPYLCRTNSSNHNLVLIAAVLMFNTTLKAINSNLITQKDISPQNSVREKTSNNTNEDMKKQNAGSSSLKNIQSNENINQITKTQNSPTKTANITEKTIQNKSTVDSNQFREETNRSEQKIADDNEKIYWAARVSYCKNIKNTNSENFPTKEEIKQFENLPIKIPIENDYLSIFLPDNVENNQYKFKPLDFKQVKIHEQAKRNISPDRPESEKPYEDDSDSTQEKNSSEDEAINPLSTRNIQKIEDVDLKKFVTEWVQEYNNFVKTKDEQIKKNGNDLDFDDLLQKMYCDVSDFFDSFFSKRKIKNIRKNSFNKKVEELISKNLAYVEKISKNIHNPEIKRICLKFYLFGLDFSQKEIFSPKGIKYKFPQLIMLLSTIGKYLLKNEVYKDLEHELNEFENIYTDEFVASKNAAIVKLKKGTINQLFENFKNPCLKKILLTSSFFKFEDRNSENRKSYTFGDAHILNINHDLRIEFLNIILKTDDLIDLVFSEEYLTETEILFSQGFYIHSKLKDHCHYEKIKTI